MADAVNELLRSHVTSVGFSLTLGKTHIAALVDLDHKLKLNLADKRAEYSFFVVGPSRTLPRSFAHFVTGFRGLEVRGLAEHIAYQHVKPGERLGELTPRKVWRITPAGRLVINLLKEAGLYQEYAAHLPPLPSTAKELKALRDKLNSYTREEMDEYGRGVKADRNVAQIRSVS